MTDQTDDVLRRLPYLTRRGFVVASGATALSVFLAACGGSNTKSTSGPSGAGTKNDLGLVLPDGAAPATDQFYVQAFDSTGASYKAMDFYETVYSRAPLADQFNIPLVRLDRNYKIQPGAATSWEQSADKLSWTFTLKPGIMWSDGKELTAADFVETMRYSADPKHAWDFSWFWSGVIKNYTEAVAGKVPTSSIGVKQGKDKYSLVIQTAGPIAYIPSACLYTTPLSAAALSKYGSGTYNINPDTCVTCGPYVLTKFDPTAHIVLEPNKKYTGPYAPPITTLIGKIYSGGDMLPRFQTGEIDTISLSPLDIKIAAGNAKTKDLHLYKNPNDFEIWYSFFDTTKPPFDNVKVRQALAHCVDRDPLINSVLAPLATPAYGYLTPGYPFAVEDPLKPLTNYGPGEGQVAARRRRLPGRQGLPRGHVQLVGQRRLQDRDRRPSAVGGLEQDPGHQHQAPGARQDHVLRPDEQEAHHAADGFRLLRHGLLRRLEHAQRLQERWPAQLGQRDLRRAARQGCGRERPDQAAGSLHPGAGAADRRRPRRLRLPPSLRHVLRPVHQGRGAGQERVRLRRPAVARVQCHEHVAPGALRRLRRHRERTPEREGPPVMRRHDIGQVPAGLRE